MKHTLIFLCCFLCSFICTAQSIPELPLFGTIDKSDLLLKECSFEKEAKAVMLINYCNMRLVQSTQAVAIFSSDIPLKFVTERRIRIKILKEGVGVYGNIKIPFYSEDEKVTQIEACTYNLAEDSSVQITPVEKKDMYTQKENDRIRNWVFAMPAVKVGSVIEYKYTLTNETEDYIPDWHFQESIPTALNWYESSIPNFFNLAEDYRFTIPAYFKEDMKTENFNGPRSIITGRVSHKKFVMTDIPSVKREPFSGATGDYIQGIYYYPLSYSVTDENKLNFIGNWREVAERLDGHPLFGKLIREELVDEASGILNEAKKIADLRKRLFFIYEKIKNSIAWNGNPGLFGSQPADKTWKSRSGNSADINLALLNLLHHSGFAAYPAFFSTVDNGTVRKEIVSIWQFNKLMVYINSGDNYFILDASDKDAIPGFTPYSVLGTKGLLLNSLESKWIDASDTTSIYRNDLYTQLSMDKNGLVTGNMLGKSFFCAKQERINNWKRGTEFFRSKYFAIEGVPVKYDSIKVVAWDDVKEPMEQVFNFTMQANGSGYYNYINSGIFSGFNNNPFLAEERQSDIVYRYQQQYHFYINLTIPEEYSFDVLPKDMLLANPDKTLQFERRVSADDNRMNIFITINFKKTVYAAAEYGILQEWYKKMLNMLAEQIVIKKSR